ncbi:hypothetical protein ABDK69_06505 [Limosilactobacillus fermentum]
MDRQLLTKSESKMNDDIDRDSCVNTSKCDIEDNKNGDYIYIFNKLT